MSHDDCGFPDEPCSTCEQREAVDPGSARDAVRVDININPRCCYKQGCTTTCW